jgi:hypothetical protein
VTSWSSFSLADQTGMVIGFLLTLSVFSYLLRDNALFRLVIHIFIGVAAAYVAAVIWYNVIWPQLLLPLGSGDAATTWLALVPLLLSILLLAKAIPRLSAAGSPALAFLVGVGAAVAIGGAITGTIVPQVLASINAGATQTTYPGAARTWLDAVNWGLILLGTIATLAYFHFGARRRGAGQPPSRAAWIEEIAGIGKLFIAVTLGAIFAGVYAASLAALVERLGFIVQFFQAVLAK